MGMRISIPPLIPLFLIQSLASPCVDELYIFVAFITVSDNSCQLSFYIIITLGVIHPGYHANLITEKQLCITTRINVHMKLYTHGI